MSRRIKLTLEVSEQQRGEILGFIQTRGWSVEEIVTEEEVVERPSPSSNDQDIFPMARHQPNYNECPHCFCSPCITDDINKQLWWPDETVLPSVLNSNKRKDIYRRFWGMLSNCGAWADPCYLAKKTDARHGDGTWHRREIMPDCVVEKCREWFPNVEKSQYMGHKWE